MFTTSLFGRSPRARCRRLGVLLVLTTAGVVLPTTPAWAPHVPQLLIEPAQAAPGDEVTVTGTRGYGFTNPVELHFDSPDGPLLGTFQPADEGYAPFGPGPVVIPKDASAGQHTIFATQQLEEFEDHIRGLPARGVVEVVGASSPILAAPLLTPAPDTPAVLVRDGTSGLLPLAVTGLGVAFAALLGGAALAAARARRGGSDAQVSRAA